MDMRKNANLQYANKAKKDEFYTQLVDIEAELSHYKRYLKNKVIYCNCDNPENSNFWKYFYDNFKALGIKRLVSTYYDQYNTTYKYVYDGHAEKTEKLASNGDFRSDECIEILKASDIVVTNPPFSLFREFVAQLIKYNKQFIIMGNMNAITYKEIFPLIKDNKMWLGYSIHSGDREFRIPNGYPVEAAGYRVDEDGTKYIRVKGIRWYSNVGTPCEYSKLNISKKYNKVDYPMFDNTDIISVDKTCNIPIDYYGLIGVPITFLDKYNPNEFEIVGNSAELAPDVVVNGKIKRNPQRFYLDGKRKYERIVIKRK